MAVQIILKNSAVKDKNPTANQLANGEIALNYFSTGPYLSAKDSTGTVWRIGGVTVAADAPGSPNAGAFWFSTSTNALNIFANGAWRSVGSGGGSSSGAVTQIIGGTGITVTPAGGTGIVTVNAAVGNGVEIDGDAIAIDLAANRGLEFVGGELAGAIATDASLGVVSVDGTSITVNAQGEIQANVGGAQDLSVANRTATSLDVNITGGDDATIPQATTSLAGLMSAADKTALDGAAANSTDLGVDTRTATNFNVTSSTGTDTTLPAATTALAGLMTAADKTALDALDGFVYVGTVDLTSDATIPAVDSRVRGQVHANVGTGNASAGWAAVSNMTTSTATTPGDIVVWNGTEYTRVPTGGVAPGTDLATAISGNALQVTSSTGTDATLPRATETNDGTFREPNNSTADTTQDFVRRSVNTGGTQAFSWVAAAGTGGSVQLDDGGTKQTMVSAGLRFQNGLGTPQTTFDLTHNANGDVNLDLNATGSAVTSRLDVMRGDVGAGTDSRGVSIWSGNTSNLHGRITIEGRVEGTQDVFRVDTSANNSTALSNKIAFTTAGAGTFVQLTTSSGSGAQSYRFTHSGNTLNLGTQNLSANYEIMFPPGAPANTGGQVLRTGTGNNGQNLEWATVRTDTDNDGRYLINSNAPTWTGVGGGFGGDTMVGQLTLGAANLNTASSVVAVPRAVPDSDASWRLNQTNVWSVANGHTVTFPFDAVNTVGPPDGQTGVFILEGTVDSWVDQSDNRGWRFAGGTPPTGTAGERTVVPFAVSKQNGENNIQINLGSPTIVQDN